MVDYENREAMVLLNRKPSMQGLIWVCYKETNEEEEVNASNCNQIVVGVPPVKILIGKTACWSVFGLFIVFGCFVTVLAYGQQIKAGQPTKVLQSLFFKRCCSSFDSSCRNSGTASERIPSHRENAGCGMLFSWAKSEQRVFWMRDTPVPLSIGYLDSTGVLFAIDEMKPNSDKFYFSFYCPLWMHWN